MWTILLAFNYCQYRRKQFIGQYLGPTYICPSLHKDPLVLSVATLLYWWNGKKWHYHKGVCFSALLLPQGVSVNAVGWVMTAKWARGEMTQCHTSNNSHLKREYEVWCKTFAMVAALSLLSVLAVIFLEKSLETFFQAGYKAEDLLPYNLHWISSKRCCFYLSHDANRMLLSVYFMETVKSKTLRDGLTNRFPVFQSVRPW